MTMKVLEKGSSFASDVEIGSGVLWLPYKNIHDTVIRASNDSGNVAFAELENCSRIYKPDFVGFLNYKARSASDRELLKKAVGEGLYLKGYDSKQALHPQIVNETLLLSDIFDINEFLALDLLSTAESIRDDYPNWARGLVAVYLYYEGRYLMIQTVISLITSIPGRTWNKQSHQRVHNMFNTLLGFTFKDDMIDKLLVLFEKSDVKVHLDLLDSNLALGDWRHRQEITRLINGIREGIAFIVFAKSSQGELQWKDTLRLIEFLKDFIRPEEDFKMGKSEVLLISAVLTSISNNISFPDYNRSFAKDLFKYLKDMDNKPEEMTGFKCVEIFEFIRLIFHVMTHKAISETNINSVHEMVDPQSEIVKDDEDFYFKKDLFAFLKNQIFSNPSIFTFEKVVMRKFHTFFIDFISFIPMKVKEMKIRSEDAAKTANLYLNQGIQSPPNLPQDYENFLDCLGSFYSQDSFGLSNDYFNPDIQFLPLNKLARGACIDSPVMFVPNAKLLKGMARSSPNEVFDLLKQNGHNFSFDHFFESIMKYMSNFGSNQPGVGTFNGHGQNIYSSDAFQKVVMDSMRITMNPAEINGICSYLDIVTVLCDNSDRIKSFFTNQKLPWIRVSLSTAKIRLIPREIRAKMIEAAASMICPGCSLETVNSLWEMFYSIRLIGQENGDLKDELDEHESRNEVYSLTISMLKLLNAIIDSRFKESNVVSDTDVWGDGSGYLDNGSFDPYLAYVRDYVLLKACFRSYKNMNERWIISCLAVKIVSKLLDHVPQLMYQMLCGSPMLRTILTTLVDCMRSLETSSGDISYVNDCSYACLNVIRRALHRQRRYLHRRELASTRREAVIVGMQELLMKVISETGRPEFMLNILKFIDNLQPETHRLAALEILALSLTDRDDIDVHLYAATVADPQLVSVLQLTFINSLYEPDTSEEVKKTILQIIRTSVVHSLPNFGIMLLGVDKKIDFQNPGVAGYPRTVLHAILDNAPTLPDAFTTLLTLIRDPRLWNALLRYLKTNHFFSNFLKEHFPSPSMSLEDVGYLLKCIAVELKTSPQPSQLAHTIIEEEFGKFQEVLNILDLDQESIDIPALEYFDSVQVMEAIKSCEYYDPKLKTRTVRLDMLEAMLREEIAKLEKNTVLRLRQTIYAEAKEIVDFASHLNSSRCKEASKIIVFDGWRQCLEILVLTPSFLKLAGVDFVTSILRILLIKIVDTNSPSEFFCRLGAETVLTLCAVMATFGDEVNSTTLNVILGYICKWTSDEQSPRVRATLYAAILHVVRMFTDANQAGRASVNSFALVLDHLSKDCCQAPEIGKMQAMYLMGEIICLTTARGLGGNDHIGKDLISKLSRETLLSKHTSSATMEKTVDSNASFNSMMGGAGDFTWNNSINNASGSYSKVQDSISVANASLTTPSNTSRKIEKVPRRPTDYLPAHSNIMTYMYAKGFLGNLVDVIKAMDDTDLVQLFSNQPMQHHLKSLFVFEAKMSLLSRFASTGQKAILLLMDVNIVNKLCDMHVFAVRYYEEESALAQQVSLSDTHNIFHSQGIPSRKSIMENLFSNALQLFHLMVDNAPKNVLLVEQIWSFLTVHDEALSNLICRFEVEENEKHNGSTLLVSLMAKIARKLPAVAFANKTSIISRLLEVLKRQAVQFEHSNSKINFVKDATLFLYNFSNNNEAVKLERKKADGSRFRSVLKNKISFDQMAENPEEELNLGVMVKLVSDMAHWVAGSQGAERDGRKLESAICIMETGLTLIYTHAELFLGVFKSEYRSTAKKFKEDFIPPLDNKLVKHLTDATKVIPKGDYLEMLLLRLRRMVHNPST